MADALRAPLVRTGNLAFQELWARVNTQVVAIRETVQQPWPRCGGETIDPAAAWARHFTDPEVVSWLEAGVFTAAAAIRLRRAGITPQQVAREYEPDVSLGLAFARGEMSVEQLLREVER